MRLLALIKNVLKELIHERIYFSGILVAVGISLLSLILGEMTFDEANKLIADFGYLAQFLILIFIAIFSGAWSLQKEMDKQTLLLVLARPVDRRTFIYARFFGVSFFTLVLSLALSCVVFLLLKQTDFSVTRSLAVGLILWAQSVALLGIVMFAAQCVRPALAAGLALVILLLGYWLGDLVFFAEKSENPFFIALVDGAHWCVPQFYRMNVKSWFALVDGIPVQVGLWALGHSLLWGFISVYFAALVFRRKDLV